MLSQVASLFIDIGLGALAYNLARSLKKLVETNSAILAQHETRITALENKESN